ncbi:MAG: hypothetical protein CMI01_18350 [Oceanospirillaceae bacterium]|nr:hypothetical protein [Oceanospirillaceae bacterium]
MTETMIDSGLTPHDVFGAHLECLHQHLRLCMDRVSKVESLDAGEQSVTFSHLIRQVESMMPLYETVVDRFTEENADLDAKLFDLSCLLERAEVVGNTAFENFDNLSDNDRSILMIDLVDRVRDIRAGVRECMEINQGVRHDSQA